MSQSPERDLPESATSLHSIFSKASSPSGTARAQHAGSLGSGACDLLHLATKPPATAAKTATAIEAEFKRWAIVRDFIVSHGDRIVHFSGECNEMLNSLPVKRYVIVTENALYRIPQTTLETGIFFQCRTDLDAFAQLVAQDVRSNDELGVTGGAEVQFFTKPPRGIGNVSIACVLNFGQDMPRRKAFLLSICVVRPTLSILQKKEVVTPEIPLDAIANDPKSPASTNRNRTGGSARKIASSPSSARVGSGVAATPYSPAQFRSNTASADPAGTQRTPSGGAAATSVPPPDMPDADFEAARRALHESLEAGSSDCIGTYDYDRAAQRPAEEDLSRTLEREKVKAMLNSREAQIVQNIEFHVKYPQKVPTRVPPGVEYDKAHEERRTLPDDFSDSELLGPSLYPLWRQWKSSGGLIGDHGMPSADWTMYDTNDLIDSLRAREDVLYGVVGKKMMRRLMEMRELVEREKQMFLNKQNMVMTLAPESDDGEDDDSAYGASPSPAKSRASKRTSKSGTVDHSQRGRIFNGQYTKMAPFHLSQGTTGAQRMKMIDSGRLLGEMKKNFQQHLQHLHELKKSQLERELQRAEDT